MNLSLGIVSSALSLVYTLSPVFISKIIIIIIILSAPFVSGHLARASRFIKLKTNKAEGRKFTPCEIKNTPKIEFHDVSALKNELKRSCMLCHYFLNTHKEHGFTFSLKIMICSCALLASTENESAAHKSRCSEE
jgi:hypothetical protein